MNSCVEMIPKAYHILLPTFRQLLVAVARFDPAIAFRRGFTLPERRTGFQIIHNELTGVERATAVRAGDADKHNLIARP